MSRSQPVAIQSNSTSNANPQVAADYESSLENFIVEIEDIKEKINQIIQYIDIKVVKKTDIAATLPGYSTVNAAWRKFLFSLQGVHSTKPIVARKATGGSKTRKKNIENNTNHYIYICSSYYIYKLLSTQYTLWRLDIKCPKV